MVELSDYTKFLMQASSLTSPFSPPYYSSGSKSLSAAGSFDTVITIPDTTDIYHLVSLSIMSIPVTYQVVQVYLNAILIYYEYSKKSINWSLGKSKAITLKSGDVLKVTVIQPDSGTRTHYWCVGFWREIDTSSFGA